MFGTNVWLSRLSIFGVVAAYACTVARALRWPGIWAKSNWLISTEFGPVKRALPGTLLHPFLPLVGGPGHAEGLTIALCMAVFALFTASVLYAALSACKKCGWQPAVVLTVMATMTTPFIVFSAHLIGYYDQIVFAFSVAACACVLRGRSGIAGLLMIIAVFIHEGVIFCGYPSVVFAAVVARSHASAAVRWRRVKLAWLVLAPIAAMIILAGVQVAADIPARQPAIQAFLSGIPFMAGKSAVWVSTGFTNSFLSQLIGQAPLVPARIFAPNYLLHDGLVPLLCIALVAYLLRGSRRYWVSFLTAVWAVLAPLGYHVVAFDTPRFWTYLVFPALLAVWCVSETRPPGPQPTIPKPLGVAAAFLIFVNAFAKSQLMDFCFERFDFGVRAALYFPAFAVAAILLFQFARDKQLPQEEGPQ